MDPLISELARIPGRVTLVLDDFHVITNPDVLECFASLVEQLPPSLGLVVAARSDPPMPLARLRVRGEMAEIRPDVLAFSDAEAAQLLTGTLDLTLSPEHVHALRDRTEGWAAGLYLAGLALRERHADDPGGFVRAFTGDDRHIADYLAAEVLDALPPAISSFLLRTCVLGRLCGSLCDAVTGSSAPRACWKRSSAPSCSWCRSTTPATGTATIRCSPRHCWPNWTDQSRAWPRSCTGAPRPGTASTGPSPMPSVTRSPQATCRTPRS